MNPLAHPSGIVGPAQVAPPVMYYPRTTLSIILVIVLAFSTLLRNDLFRDAADLWLDTCQKSPGKSRPFNSLGTVYAGRGEYDQAIECFSRAITNGYGRQDLHQYNLGLAYSRKGDHRRAISAFQMALAVKPEYVDAYYELSISLRSEGLLYDAEKALRSAIMHAPDRPGLHNDLGSILLLRGRYSDAEKEFLVALGYDPNYPEASYNLAMNYEKMGKRKEALQAYGHFLDVAPLDLPGRLEAEAKIRALTPSP